MSLAIIVVEEEEAGGEKEDEEGKESKDVEQSRSVPDTENSVESSSPTSYS